MNMENYPKQNIYEEPDGYFENLSNRIISKQKARRRHNVFIRIAAAAVLVIGAVLFVNRQPSINIENLQTQIDREVELFISSGYWDADDILSLTDNPDDLLDFIIEEEWSGYMVDDSIEFDDAIEEEIWY